MRCIIYIYRTNLSLYIYIYIIATIVGTCADGQFINPLTNDWLTYTSTFTLFYWEKLEHTTLFLVAKSVVLVKPISGVQIVILTSITHLVTVVPTTHHPSPCLFLVLSVQPDRFWLIFHFNFGCWKIISISFCFTWFKPPLQKTMLTQNLHFECAVSTYSQAQKDRKSNKCQHFGLRFISHFYLTLEIGVPFTKVCLKIASGVIYIYIYVRLLQMLH